MTPQTWALLSALGASLSFASASLLFTQFSRRISPLWMNTVKALVCGVAISSVLIVTNTWDDMPTRSQIGLLLSGAVGLGIGDIFLLTAFARIGASRSLLIFGFQPLVMAVAASVLFDQSLHLQQGIAIVFFIICLISLSLERYRQEGHWELLGLGCALVGVLLDNTGVLLTRAAFEAAPSLGPLQANLFRIGGALGVYFLLSFVKPINLWSSFKSLAPRKRTLAIAASFFGTFMSLALYLNAIKHGSLAVISGITLTGPLFAGLVESALSKRRPSNHQIVAFLCLIAGMGLVLLGNT